MITSPGDSLSKYTLVPFEYLSLPLQQWATSLSLLVPPLIPSTKAAKLSIEFYEVPSPAQRSHCLSVNTLPSFPQ